MHWVDWLIVLIPLAFVLGMGWHSRRYIKGVADFLSAGRLCGRYVISAADAANGLSIISLVAYVEVHYKTGFALTFWQNLLIPLSVIISLTGYCIYRFRETRSMSLGQFLEMRYNRTFRIFASGLRSLSEMLANMICPAVAARFFIYYLDLPPAFEVFGISIPTYMTVVVIALVMAVGIILMGGTLALVITDTIQGLLFYPVLAIFIVFILWNLSWSGQIVPVMLDRAPKESFLNPYDISGLRDFNFVMLLMMGFNAIMHRVSWTGAGNSTTGKTPHEQKMANILGTWRGSITAVFYLLLAVMVLTHLNHRDFAADAKSIRTGISSRVAGEILSGADARRRFAERIDAMPAHDHAVGRDAPLSEKKNLDTPYLDIANESLRDTKGGEARYQEFRTLYHQLMLPATMRHVLPAGLAGLFCLLMILAMLSTDDTRIYSAALTLAQDVVLPLKKSGFTPEGHVRMIRCVSVGVGLFWMFGSFFMAQLDYIQLYVSIMTSMWIGGCGPVMIFGLYSRFGTTAGAFASLISGMILSFGGIFLQRNWASMVYPWLDRMELVEPVDNVLSAVSGPLSPYVVWEMNPNKFPVNAYEIYLMIMAATLALYVGVSLLTRREPFNLDRMLHRGKYDIEGEHKKAAAGWSIRGVFTKLIGITPEYTRGDRIIAKAVFIYSFGYTFLAAFVFVVVFNYFSPWPITWWGHYFLIVSLVVPGIVAAVSTVWFTAGGFRDMVRLFRDLKARSVNPLDDGRVEGHMSLADKTELENVDRQRKAQETPSERA